MLLLATYWIVAPRAARLTAASSPDPAGPRQKDLAPLQVAEDLCGERRRGGRYRGRVLSDRSLGPHSLAKLESLPEHPVEERAGGGGVESGTDLAEDLALARNERVQPGRDPEEMQGGRVIVHPIGDRAEWLAGKLLERRERTRTVVVAGEVQLGAVARREADSVSERACEQRSALERQRHALPQLDRRHVVRDPDQRERQKWLPASATRVTITSAKPSIAR